MENLEYLESLSEVDVPEEICVMSQEEVSAVRVLVDSVLEKERRGIDSLFDSMTHTMKYIPNFLLQALTTKFIEPPIAARIAEKLQFKQAVSVAKGISAEYLAEVSYYLSVELAADLLDELPGKLSKSVIELLIHRYPFKLLDICDSVKSKSISSGQRSKLLKVLEGQSLSSHRQQQFDRVSVS